MKEVIGIICFIIIGVTAGAIVAQYTLKGPDRWNDVNIEQINAAGDVVQRWPHAEILTTWGTTFGTPGVRFKILDGSQVSLMVPHRFIYNDKE